MESLGKGNCENYVQIRLHRTSESVLIPALAIKFLMLYSTHDFKDVIFHGYYGIGERRKGIGHVYMLR